MSDKGASQLKWLIGYEHTGIDSVSRFSLTRTPTRTNVSPSNFAVTQLDTKADTIFGSLGYQFNEQFTVLGEVC